MPAQQHPLTHPQAHFEALKKAYPGRRLLIVSNTAGASSWDPKLKQAAEVEDATGLVVLPHSVKKPGCGSEIMEYFKRHPETGVTHPSQVAVVGDRLTTDMMLANMMGGWGFWVKDGVIPLQKKSIVCSLAFPAHRNAFLFTNHICSSREWSGALLHSCWLGAMSLLSLAAHSKSNGTSSPVSQRQISEVR